MGPQKSVSDAWTDRHYQVPNGVRRGTTKPPVRRHLSAHDDTRFIFKTSPIALN